MNSKDLSVLKLSLSSLSLAVADAIALTILSGYEMHAFYSLENMDYYLVFKNKKLKE